MYIVLYDRWDLFELGPHVFGIYTDVDTACKAIETSLRALRGTKRYKAFDLKKVQRPITNISVYDSFYAVCEIVPADDIEDLLIDPEVGYV